MTPQRTLICLSLIWLYPAAAPAEASKDSLSEIWQVLSARQAEATTAKVSWAKRLRKSAAAVRRDMFDGPSPAGGGSAVSNIDLPPAPCSLYVSGEKACRYENWGLSFARGNQGLPYRSIITFDETGTYRSFSEKAGKAERHSGRIDERGSPPVWDALHIVPLVFALRPLRPEAFGPSAATWKIEGAPAVIDGRECLVLRGRPPAFAPGDAVYEIFLDPGRNHVPLRYVGKNLTSGKIFSQVDMRYDRAEEPHWIPSEWKATSFLPSGEVSEDSENDAIEVALGVTLPEDTFQIDYPSGTVISDGRFQGLGQDQHFVVEPDGNLIPLRREEAEASAGNSNRLPWIVAAVAAAAFGGALLLWWRRPAAVG